MKHWILFALLVLAPAAFAAPNLFDTYPGDNGFVGKGSIFFRVNVSTTGDIPNANLFVISEDAYNNQEPWETFPLFCSNYTAQDWLCSRSVSFSIAGTDTTEFFYFTANDSSGQNSLGSSSQPLKFRIDRTSPQVTFLSPLNNSYIAGNALLEVLVYDTVSGVNDSLLEYSLNGGSWFPFQDNRSYINTAAYQNNEHIVIRVNATDILGNNGIPSIIVTVDNEAPELNVIYPQPGSVLKDNATFNVEASDNYAGLNSSSILFSMNNIVQNMSCTGVSIFSCTYNVDTLPFSDGEYNVTFSAADKMNNSRTVIVPVTIKNSKPSMSLSPGGYVKDVVQVAAVISNTGGVITGVSLRINDSPGVQMNCTSSFASCTYELDTMYYGDGGLLLNATAANTAGYDISSLSWIIIDNTPPVATIEMTSVVKTSADITARVTDNSSDPASVFFRILGNDNRMDCYQSSPMICHITYGFSSMTDGRYNVSVRAFDYAGNLFEIYKEIFIDNHPPELVSLKIEPLNPTSSSGVMITADISEKGSSVKSAYAKVRNGAAEYRVDLSFDGVNWSAQFHASETGAYVVDIFTEDMNSNAANFTEIGYFFMGRLVSCGNSICESVENYCLCPSDCPRPACGGIFSCSSGIPLCRGLGCGDGFCSVTESCSSCPLDCGGCAKTQESKISDVAGAAGTVYVFATDYTPIFVTLIAIAAISVIVILALRKKFSSGSTA